MGQNKKKDKTMAIFDPDYSEFKKENKKKKIIDNAESTMKSIHSSYEQFLQLWDAKIDEIAEMESDGTFKAKQIKQQKDAMDTLALLVGKPKPYNS